MNERDFVYIQHILECINKINNYAKNGKNDFYNNEMVQDAILRRLQTMAESTQRLSKEIKDNLPNINWQGLSGFRNILVHDYLDGIDIENVWYLIENYLPDLEIGIKNIVEKGNN
jgi:uncharacterized protein with HEPN domain